MSVQFGKCNFDGKPVDPHDLDEVRPVLAPYGPDGEGYICKDNLGILYCSFYTTKESRREIQPLVLPSEFVLTWDGRLDNRTELIKEMMGEVLIDSTDLEVVAAALRRWGTSAFARLIGDWALSIWNPADRSLILAKDFLGARPLHYSIEDNQATWCTVLDPFVLFRNHPLELKEEYIAGWLGLFPATHFTPYRGIYSVPPSSFVQIRGGEQKLRRYWDFESTRQIRYQRDEDYEEHLRDVFSESVRRRLRSDSPILAELSGGMDSSSIVCVADDLLARGSVEARQLDTVSFYDESEPNWNEWPYFTKVEERRGKIGCRIDLSSQEYFRRRVEDGEVCATPASGPNTTTAGRAFSECVAHQKCRILLSGIGGDEVTGGVPTPITELADLLSAHQFRDFARQTKIWALDKRTPWFYLLSSVIAEFLPLALRRCHNHKGAATWLAPAFIRRNRPALWGYEKPLNLFGPLPSFQANLATLNALRRQIGCLSLPREPIYERRYPYLDRDFLEFVFAIPREQLLRPGQRRSLIRRALTGIVPSEILNRRRKAFVSRAPIAAIAREWPRLAALRETMTCDSLGIVDRKAFFRVLEAARQGHEVPVVTLLRTIALEDWLNNVIASKVLRSSGNTSQAADSDSSTSRNSSCSRLDTILGRE